nr:hypothetical protein [Desulfobacterales bacterium]
MRPEMLGAYPGCPALPVLVTVAMAIGWDLKQRRIPNGLTALAAAAGIIFHAGPAAGGQGAGMDLTGLFTES